MHTSFSLAKLRQVTLGLLLATSVLTANAVEKISGKYISITGDRIDIVFSSDGQWMSSLGEGGKVSFSDETIMLVGSLTSYRGTFYGDAIELSGGGLKKICMVKTKPTGDANFSTPALGLYMVAERQQQGLKTKAICKWENNCMRADEYDMDNPSSPGRISYILANNRTVRLNHVKKEYAVVPSSSSQLKGIPDNVRVAYKKAFIYKLTDETQEFYGYTCNKVIVADFKGAGLPGCDEGLVINWVAKQHPCKSSLKATRLKNDDTELCKELYGDAPLHGVILKEESPAGSAVYPYVFKAQIPAEDFEIPSDYREAPFTPNPNG